MPPATLAAWRPGHTWARAAALISEAAPDQPEQPRRFDRLSARIGFTAVAILFAAGSPHLIGALQ